MGYVGDVLKEILVENMNKLKLYNEYNSGKKFSLTDLQNPNKATIIGHKIVHSNDGNLVIVGGYENITGTWSNVVRRLDCTTLKKDTNPECHWLDMYDGILTTGREDHVAMMLHNNFCKKINIIL